MATARRTAGWRFLLADPEYMEHLVAVFLDGSLVIWRESGQLVFGALFSLKESLYYSDDKAASISRRTVFLHDYMARKRPEIADDPAAACAETGYPPDAYSAMAGIEARDIRKTRDSEEGALR
ncbi:Uncharacterised protein [Slackia heliotrinireducens]|uniref:Uncharacterized protein n=1 Tax=Slackia heliotrinireducens (strain ATCC 29202 / DSM 20476 / NCTC 11029 / RHS 1) TaxID=471855 RepID=C7N0Z6_SLAHD|nr:hypothetical protein [Slackia heliotrinireducens]ACV23218.1 hypothetical protein Shel_22080 [Slackia heliotrinireducens DSM 20476]VEH02329.1 Uncharacterised protein [Slackia heliotrinireducens]